MLVDSNIIIYAVSAEDRTLRPFFKEQLPKVSIISRVEVLGYHKLTNDVRKRLEALFNWLRPLPLTNGIIEKAIWLRQQRKLCLGDALIAGTALENRLTLVTRNTHDFKWINGLTLFRSISRSFAWYKVKGWIGEDRCRGICTLDNPYFTYLPCHGFPLQAKQFLHQQYTSK